MNKPTVGQILYSLNVGNSARGCEQKLTPSEVIKVGRKYFTCKKTASPDWDKGGQFHLSDWHERSHYSANEQLFESEQKYLDHVESNKIKVRLREFFEWNIKLSLKSLREIQTIIDND
jgi:hypothetical protein